jgi:hypothetical protein
MTDTCIIYVEPRGIFKCVNVPNIHAICLHCGDNPGILFKFHEDCDICFYCLKKAHDCVDNNENMFKNWKD